jgi:hypothetical protein
VIELKTSVAAHYARAGMRFPQGEKAGSVPNAGDEITKATLDRQSIGMKRQMTRVTRLEGRPPFGVGEVVAEQLLELRAVRRAACLRAADPRSREFS